MNHWSRRIVDAFVIGFVCLLLVLMTTASNANDHVIDNILQELEDIHQRVSSQREEDCQLPIVTVSFAQSLDGKLAPFKDSSHSETVGNYPLSGQESMRLTHAIRSMHDGILIGGRTLSLDNPRLNNRLWKVQDNMAQPTPIVLDTHLDHLITIKDSLKAHNLIVCCSEQAAKSLESLPEPVLLCPCPIGSDGRIDLRRALSRLYNQHGIRTLMVEGGAEVISSFFNTRLVDALCITIAPTLLNHGIAPDFGPEILDLRDSAVVHRLGLDSIVLSSLV